MPETAYKQMMAPWVRPLAPIPAQVTLETTLATPVRAVLFDIYGTIFISASGDIGDFSTNPDLATLIKALLSDYNISKNPETLRRQLVQAILSDHETRKKQGVDFPEVRIDQIWQQVLNVEDMAMVRQFAVAYEMIFNPVYPMPGLQDIIQTLKNKNISMGIISNAQFFTPHLFDLFLDGFPEELGFDPDLIFYSYEYGYAKPSRFLFDLAAKNLFSKGLDPEETLYVGNDVEKDIVPARKTGFKTCLFAGDQRSLRTGNANINLETLKPDAVICDLKQIADMIG